MGSAAPTHLTLGVVQQALEVELWQNRDKIVRFIGEASSAGCRVVVFPEGALHAPPATRRTAIDAAITTIREAAAQFQVYVVLGLLHRLDDDVPLHNRLLVIGPDGGVILSYDKLRADPRFDKLPGVFLVDSIPCSAIICADRWIRAVEDLPVIQGAQISFECSNNYADEWIPDLGWYWYVPRAIRNGVYVVFTNTPRDNPGRDASGHGPGHGHSAVVAPDGRVIAAAGEEADRLLVATVDLRQATRSEALRRRHQPIFAPFWEAGLQLAAGEAVDAPAGESATSPEIDVTIAAAQIACSRRVGDNVARIVRLVGEAKGANADVVVFPELALTGALDEDVRALDSVALAAALERISVAARDAGIVVVVGAPTPRESGLPFNSAYVIDAAGHQVTRYDQIVVERPDLFAPGSSTRTMWCKVKGVPAVVTVGQDARWNEIAELAALRGAQLHLHLCYDRDESAEATVRRKQFWVNLASYYTFTATVNAAAPTSLDHPSAPANGQSMIWNDFRPSTNHRRLIDGRAWFCAVPLAQAASGEQLLVATQQVPATNLHLRVMTEKTLPHLRPWYSVGTRVIDVPVSREGRGVGCPPISLDPARGGTARTRDVPWAGRLDSAPGGSER